MRLIRKLLKHLDVARRAFLCRNARIRYEARHGLASSLAGALGFRVYNRNLAWVEDDEFLGILQEFDAGTTHAKDRYYTLYSMARATARLSGDTVECGVFRGQGSFLICRANDRKADHKHHIFDSFAGLSAPDSADIPDDDKEFRWREHDLSVSLDTVKQNLSMFSSIDYHEGWIPERFPDVENRRFAFVHIDVDLYQPTLDSLEFFYPRTVPGGIILCDDYGFLSCPGARSAFDKFTVDKPEQPVVHLTTGQGFIVKEAAK